MNEHFERLDNDYFLHFDDREIEKHILAISNLSKNILCQVSFENPKEKLYIFTVVGFDFKGLFSTICGLLTLRGFDIRSGQMFTYGKSRVSKNFFEQRKKIIDRFELGYNGHAAFLKDFEFKFFSELNEYLLLIQQGNHGDVRNSLHKRIGNYLSGFPAPGRKLFPLEISFETEQPYTVMRITGEDTPAFLYALSNALFLKNISIHRIFIKTFKNKVDDVIYITDAFDLPVQDGEYLNKLKAFIVLIKQFTLFLPLAPDFDLAMRHFDQFLEAFISGKTIDSLSISSPEVLSSLARIFGTGTFLWEEFTKMQYVHLLPWLKNRDELRRTKDRKVYLREIQRELCKNRSFSDFGDSASWELNAGDSSFEEEVFVLNQYKDRELFRIDLSQIIFPGKTLFEFSGEISALADALLIVFCQLIYEALVKKHGVPHMKNNVVCKFCLLALGKFGGEELGYASDIELVLVYEDKGETLGKDSSITNIEFFDALVMKLKTAVKAKSAGIFEIDLQLRPHGSAGPLACTFLQWKKYFSPDGAALDYERQALIKLRPVFGDKDFSKKIMQERDSLIYRDKTITPDNALELRQKQIIQFVRPGKVNAKYSEGGLVEIEYSVQFLQLREGKRYPRLREPNTVKALEVLLEYGILSPTEFEKLFQGYVFLRRLINALRMVRGNAKDLEVPDYDSEEFVFLAKRMGYVSKGCDSPSQRLFKDIEVVFHEVKTFIRYRFKSPEKQSFSKPGLSDLLLNGHINSERQDEILGSMNFKDVSRSFKIFKAVMQRVVEKNTLAAVFVLAQRYISASPDPDLALIQFEKFLSAALFDKRMLHQLLFHPRYIELLILIFGYSDYLSGLLFIDPYLIFSVAKEENLLMHKLTNILEKELREVLQSGLSESSLDLIRKFRNKEMLRIGLRDIYLSINLEQIVREISDLSDVILKEVFFVTLKKMNLDNHADGISVIALGKLGGRELNYSSDIDLVFVSHSKDYEKKMMYQKTVSNFICSLTEAGPFGKLFRVDTTLRPYGSQGDLVGTFEYLMDYYKNKAQGWELQCWLKARMVSGNREQGELIIQKIHSILFEKNPEDIFKSHKEIRFKKLAELKKQNLDKLDVKSGAGGIRTIEFFVQDLQVRFGNIYPELVDGNTMLSLKRLFKLNLISDHKYHFLKKAYLFLRKVEHRIQLLGLQQLHALPVSETELEKLAKRAGFEDSFEKSAVIEFSACYHDYRKKLEEVSEQFFNEKS